MKRARGDSSATGSGKRVPASSPALLNDLNRAISPDSTPRNICTLLAPILRECRAQDAAGNADGVALCICEAYFVLRSLLLQATTTLSSSISGAAPSKVVAKALK
jgi:hypothetical protein